MNKCFSISVALKDKARVCEFQNQFNFNMGKVESKIFNHHAPTWVVAEIEAKVIERLI